MGCGFLFESMRWATNRLKLNIIVGFESFRDQLTSWPLDQRAVEPLCIVRRNSFYGVLK